MSDWDYLNGTTSNSSSSTMNQQPQFTSKSRNSSRESGLSHLIGIEEYEGEHSSKMSTLNKKSSSPSSPISPQTKVSNDKSKYLVHQLTPKDTLQGLALKYNVKVNDIKRINNMWTQDSLFIKKTILIPIEVSDLSSSENNSNSSGSGNNSLNSSSNNIKSMEGNGNNNGSGFNGNSNTFDNVFPEFEKMNKTFGSPLPQKEKPILPPSTFNNSNNNRNNNSESIFNNRPNSTLSFSPVVNSLDQKTQTHFSLLDDEWNPL